MACVTTKSIAQEHDNVDCVVAMTKASFTLAVVLVKNARDSVPRLHRPFLPWQPRATFICVVLPKVAKVNRAV
jgi:hypothetical protein